MKLLAAVITSSPGPISKARNASSSADVPESTPIAYCASQKAANSSSKRRTSRPKMKSVSWITLDIASLISPAIAWYWTPKSTKGTFGCFGLINIWVDIVRLILHWYLQSFKFDRTIHGFEHPHHIPPIRSVAQRTLSRSHALQEVPALIFQRFSGL